jgi:hypothetical protein
VLDRAASTRAQRRRAFDACDHRDGVVRPAHGVGPIYPAEILTRAAQLGFPSVHLTRGGGVPAGQAAWSYFIVTASVARLLNAQDALGALRGARAAPSRPPLD